MAREGSLSLSERPIMHPDTVISNGVRADVAQSLSAELAIDRLSPIAEAQVHAQLAAGDGITRPLPGYEYLFAYGNAVAEIVTDDPDATRDLARATPLQAVKLGAFMAASAVERMIGRQRLYATDAAYDEGGVAARAVIANHAAEYRESDQEAAIGSAYALVSDDQHRTAEATAVAEAFIAKTRATLTDQDVATHAVGFWAARTAESSGEFMEGEVMNDVPYYTAPEALAESFDERFATASSLAARIMDSSHVEPADTLTSTPLDQYRRGALRAMAYVALATKEFGLQVAAGIPPRRL
jgi:hypothetical protein